MKPACMRANNLGHRRGEGNHIVAYLGLDLPDALHGEIGALANRVRRLFRHHTRLSQSFGSGDFHGQPGTKAVFVAPDAAHFRAGIARDQGGYAPYRSRQIFRRKAGQRILNGAGENRPAQRRESQ